MARHTKGVVLVELLVAFGLASILLPALLTGFVSATQGREVYEQRVAATALVRETEEAIRSFRNETWINISNLASGASYHPAISGSKWSMPTGNETVNGFTRVVTVADVYRDASGKIAAQGTPGATLDPSTRQFLITVSWPGFFTRTIASSLYITRNGNTSFSETQTVSAPAGGFGDWCKPTGPSVTNVNLNRQGHPTSLRAFETPSATDGNRILAGTGANSSGPAFTNIKIIGNGPPAATILGDYNGTPQVKVNGLFGDNHYGFVATDNRGVEILDLTTTPPYQKIGSFNPNGMKNVNDVYVVGNTGYAVTQDKFYIFSVSADRKTTSQIGSLALANGAKVVVDASNQYAYVPNPDSSGELKIVDVHTHPTGLTSADVKNVDVDAGAGKDVFINASVTFAYLATAANATKPEFFIINITDKANPVVITNGGTYDTNGMDPHGVTIVSGERAIIVGTGGNEYQVFSVAGGVVSFCLNHSQGDDFLNIDSGVYAVASVLQTDQHAYSYIVTGDSGAELKIIEGGPGNGGVGGNGTYESPTLPSPDPGHDVAFNSFSATINPDLAYKVSIKHGVGGSCSSVTFSDGDFTSFIPGTLPLITIGSGYTNPGECLRYRAINSGSSPITFTATFNYSP